MIKKVVVLAVVLVALTLGSAFAFGPIGDSLWTGDATNVYVNPGGTGDVLLYGYYNVRGPWQTLFSVTNTDSENGARVRLRFREAATLTGSNISGCSNGSQEVLDFDICLSKNDVWSGRIINSDAGALLKSDDNDTAVQVCEGANCIGTFAEEFPNGQVFKSGSSNLDITADQTKEGYFEVIAEQSMSENCGGTDEPDCTCGDLIDEGGDVANVLMGHTYIVNLSDTTTFAYAATALADFASGNITPSPLFGGNNPNLALDSETGTIVPVNYALTKSNLYSIYDLESNIGAKADLIVTFPTKWATHDENVTGVTGCEDINTDDIFDDPSVLVKIFDDAENAPEESCQFSPCTPGETTLPNEVNVVDLNGSHIFTSDVIVSLSTGFQFGWINIDLVNNGLQNGPNPIHETCINEFGFLFCSEGLPAIGYAVEKFAGGKFSGLIPLQYGWEVFQD